MAVISTIINQKNIVLKIPYEMGRLLKKSDMKTRIELEK
jgi:hypothetical protein